MPIKPFIDDYDDYLQTSKNEYKDLSERSFQEQELVRSAAERDPRQYRGIGYGGLTGEQKEAITAAGMTLPQDLVARENVQQKYRRTGQAKGFGFDETPLQNKIVEEGKPRKRGEYDDAEGGAPGEGDGRSVRELYRGRKFIGPCVGSSC